MNGYDLSRQWFDFAFENPDLINPGHAAVYFFAIEHCNRLGWKEKFGLPSQMAMDAIGIKKNHTYTKYFNDLVDWGFIKVVQRSKNQYSSNIISLQSAKPKNGQALGKAMAKHAAKHGQSTRQSTGHIDKPLTIEPNNQITKSARASIPPLNEFLDYACKVYGETYHRNPSEITASATLKYQTWVDNNWHTGHGKEILNWKNTLRNTLPNLKREIKPEGKLSRQEQILKSIEDNELSRQKGAYPYQS